MADTNKVIFGLENVHIGKYNVSATGVVSLGSPVHVPGAVGLTLDPESEENVFWADNVKYYTSYSDNGFSGELEMARYDDSFKTQFLNYVALTGGGIAQVKGKAVDPVYIVFESSGDKQKRRGILYNVSLGAITREYGTTEDTQEPQTATLAITVNGDNGTGIIKAEYTEGTNAYNSMFTTPPVPSLPGASS